MFSRNLFVSSALVSVLALVPSSVRAQEWPYRAELPLAKGFHVEERPRYGLIIGGAVPLALGTISLLAGLSERAKCKSSEENLCELQAGVFTVTGVLAMTTGGILLLVGLLKPRLVVVPGDPTPREPLAPGATPKEREPRLSFGFSDVGSGSGFSFQGAF